MGKGFCVVKLRLDLIFKFVLGSVFDGVHVDRDNARGVHRDVLRDMAARGVGARVRLHLLFLSDAITQGFPMFSKVLQNSPQGTGLGERLTCMYEDSLHVHMSCAYVTATVALNWLSLLWGRPLARDAGAGAHWPIDSRW